MNSSPLLQLGYHFKSLFISPVRSVQVSGSISHCLASPFQCARSLYTAPRAGCVSCQSDPIQLGVGLSIALARRMSEMTKHELPKICVKKTECLVSRLCRAYRHNAGFFARVANIDIITESAKWSARLLQHMPHTQHMKWWILAQWGQESAAKVAKLVFVWYSNIKL